jgi:hypothetical protein
VRVGLPAIDKESTYFEPFFDVILGRDITKVVIIFPLHWDFVIWRRYNPRLPKHRMAEPMAESEPPLEDPAG